MRPAPLLTSPRRSLLFLLLGVAACGGGDEPATTAASLPPAPAAAPAVERHTIPPPALFEPLSLLPAETVAVIRCRSMRQLEDGVRKIAGMIERAGGTPADMLSLEYALRVSGIDPSTLRRTEPVVFAAWFPEDTLQPEFVVYAPAELVAHRRAPRSRAVEVAGGYVAITRPESVVPDPARPAWTEDLPDGLISARIDVAALAERFGPLAALALGSLQLPPDVAPEVEVELRARQEELLGLALGARSLEVVADIKDGTLTTSAWLEGAPGSFGGGSEGARGALETLAPHLRCETPFVLASAFDVDDARATAALELESALADAPPELRAHAARIQDAVLDFFAEFDPGVVVQVEPTPGKMFLAVILRSERPRTAHQALGRLLTALELEDLGFELSLPVQKRLGAAIVEDFTFRFDTRRLSFDQRAAMREGFARFLGDPDLHLKIATSGDDTMLLLGGETAAIDRRVRAFSRARELPSTLTAPVAALQGAAPASVWRVDVLRLVTLGAELASIAEGKSPAAARHEALQGRDPELEIPVTAWGGVRGDTALGGLSVRLTALEAALELFLAADR